MTGLDHGTSIVNSAILLGDLQFLVLQLGDFVLPQIHTRQIARLQQLYFGPQKFHFLECSVLNLSFLACLFAGFPQLLLLVLVNTLDDFVPILGLSFQSLELLFFLAHVQEHFVDVDRIYQLELLLHLF